jgi:hypothetical protein
MAWMQTYTGIPFDLTKISAELIHLKDITVALSRQPRFGGHTTETYSVAQHSVLVSEMVRANGGSDEQILAALLHDAHEAYLGDIPSPIKWVLGDSYEGFRKLEQQVDQAVANAFGIDAALFHGELVKHADVSALWWEKQDLMSDVTHDGYEWNWDVMLGGEKPFDMPVDEDGESLNLTIPWADFVAEQELEAEIESFRAKIHYARERREVGEVKVFT